MPRVLFRAVAALVLITSIGVLDYFARNSRAAAAAPDQAKHGLTGYYYVSAHETQNDTPPAGSFVQAWHSPNDFHLPRVAQNLQTPAAVRVDPQVAFGKGKGFVPENGQQSVWWPANYPVPASWSSYLASIYIPDAKPWEYLAAVIWKGHIHLPKAGTYYFATVSNWTSAVYVNQARVALNGAGVMVSDAFSYAKEDIQDFAINLRQASSMEGWTPRPCPESCYVVPVTVDAPRDLPIEVRLSAFVTNKNGLVNAFHTGSAWGIDLFWITPDSPRDANGKPMAQIVPSDALYTEVPSQMEKPIVRSANSTVSADFLYFPGQSAGSYVTVSVRLADKNGNPVAGKRVHVTSLVTAGPPDSIVQPEKPTDENGVTIAKVLPVGGYGHDSTIFATDLTDFVDIAQVAHVTFQSEANTSFFPDAFSPYYDGGKIFTVEPLPLRVGRPVTIKIHLQNHTRVPHDLTATFLAQGANIGGTDWQEIGKPEGIRLMPGESKEASIAWTPQKESGHMCFRVDLGGHPVAAYQPGLTAPSAMLLPVAGFLAYAQAGGTSENNLGSVQQNIGPVEPCTPPNTADPTMFGLPGVNVINSRYGNFRAYPKKGKGSTGTVDPSTYPYDPERDEKFPHAHPGNDHTSHDANDHMTGPGKWAHAPVKLPFTSPIKGEVRCLHKLGSAKCEGDPYNTIGVISCDGKYTIQFLHASRVDVQNGESVSRGTQLGVTGGFAPPPGCPKCPGKQDQVDVHLHVQARKNDDDSYVDPNAEGPLVDPPACDPWPCPQVGPRPGPPAFYQNQGPISQGGSPLSGGVKKRATDFCKNLGNRAEKNTDEGFDDFAPSHFSQSDLDNLSKWAAAANHARKCANDPPDVAYQRLSVAASDSVVGYMDALASSMERYRGAQAAGDRDWTARQFTAMQLYLKRIARALRQDAGANQKEAERLPVDDATTQARLETERQQVLERLRRTGLTPEEFKALRAAGIPEGTARVTMYRVLGYPQESMAGKLMDPEEGYTDVNPLPVRSARAMLLDEAAEERNWADEAEQIAMLPAGSDAEDSSSHGFLQSYTVGNPHDREENVDLSVRPISIPPDWKLSIVNAVQPTAQGEKAPGDDAPQYPVREIEPGKHYAVTLPAKGQVKVASVLIPVGELGAHTTARWAVEGRIGNELIGGMVHEMNVPYAIADLQLPPVGSVETEEAPIRVRHLSRAAVIAMVAGVLVLAVLLFAILVRRRRDQSRPAGPA